MADYQVSIALAAKVSDYVRGMDVAAKATSKLGEAQRHTAASGQLLAASLTESGAAAKASAGDLNAATRQVRALERAEAKLAATRKTTPAGPAGTPTDPLRNDPRRTRKTGEDTGKSFLDGLASSFAGIGGELTPALIAGGVVASPLIGATIAGAVVGGAGIGGVVGGLVLASKDARVKEAGSALGRDVMGDLERRSKVFITPALQGVSALRRGYASLGPELDRVFSGSAKLVAPLVAGAVKGVSAITHGVADAIAKSGPVITAVGDAESRIGAAVGKSLTDLSAHAGEGASAIERITTDMVQLIGITTEVVGGLSTLYGWYDNIDKKVASFTGAGIWENLLVPIPGVGRGVQWLEDYVSKTGDAKTASDGTAAGLAHVGAAAGAAKPHLTDLQVQQAVLNGTMLQGIAAAGGLAQALRILNGGSVDAVEAEIRYQQAIDDVTAARKANGRSVDDGTTKGRANLSTLTTLTHAVEANADAVYRKAGGDNNAAAASKAAAVEYERGRRQLVRSAEQFTGTKAAAEALVATWLKKPPSWKLDADASAAKKKIKDADAAATKAAKPRTFNFGVHTGEAMAKAAALKKAADDAAKARLLSIGANTGAASSRLNKVEEQLRRIDGMHASASVTVTTSTSSVNAAEYRLSHPGAARGAIAVPMAAGGVANIYPASNPPLYRYAEPETGGEAFIPRRGDRARGRMLVGEVASWYGMRATPMAAGGVAVPAAAGLVNVASVGATTKATRLDYAEAYVQTRDAVTSLNQSLKDNGRSFTFATSKGRENRSALYSVIRAAQDAAKTKFEETGSVRQADRAYDGYIARLKATLAQQKLNATQIRALLSVAGRPVYDTGSVAPKNSLLNIGFAKSLIGARGSLADLQDSLSLNGPTTSTGSKEGRDNLTNILGFLEAASSAAQDRYAQTGSSKSATALYNGFVTQLRAALSTNGYAKTAIDKLITEYGRITLVPNAAGGVYGAQAYGAGSTLYQFREPSTKGEAFIPRQGGSQASADRVLAIAAGWRGGQYIPQGAIAGGSGGGHSSSLVVNNYGDRMTLSQFRANQRELDVKARVGRNS